MSTGRCVLLEGAPLAGGPPHDVALGPVLLRHGLGDATELVRIFVPSPTAAFSRRDSLRPGFPAAVGTVRRAGFTPVVRFPGGRLAAYHRGSVVMDHVHRAPGLDLAVDQRFVRYAQQVVDVLRTLGVAARIGEVPGEYCPGAFTVNAGGAVKLAGSAQRVTKDGWLFSTVLQVSGSEGLRPVLAAAYEALGYDFDVGTVGTVEDLAPGTTAAVAAAALGAAWRAAGAEVATSLPDALMAAVDELVASVSTF